MEVLTIDRSKWHNGSLDPEKYGIPALLDKNGMMCCLGFESLRCGLKEGNIRNKPTPTYVSKMSKIKIPHLSSGKDYTNFTVEAMEINDDPDRSRYEREHDLKRLFAEEGIKIKFVGRSPRN